MAKRKQASKTLIKQILQESAFDPRETGPYKVIADMDNPIYYANRAIEFIHTGLAGNYTDFDAGCAQAISMLVLARANIRLNRG